jgi:hypothetical protein
MGFWTTAIVCFSIGVIQTAFWLLFDADEEFAVWMVQTKLPFLSIQIACWIFPFGCYAAASKAADYGRHRMADQFQSILSPQQILLRALEPPVNLIILIDQVVLNVD